MYFTALFELILVRSLATPDSACRPMTNTTEIHSAQLGFWNVSADEGDDLQAESGEQRAVEPGAGADPAAEQVGDDPHELVGEEQERDRDRRVAELVEVAAARACAARRR